MVDDALKSPGKSDAPTAHEGKNGPPRPNREVPKTDDRGTGASDRPGGAASLVGTLLSGRYRIERLLGEGGMGAVYQAEHTHMRKRLAVKVLHPEMSRLPEVVARFEREAMAAAHIDHPNVATATDFGKLDDGSFFLVLEFVEGKSLRASVAKGRLELGRTLHIVWQVAAGLQRAHALNIVHRDLKPENVMLVERDGDPDFVKVLDFGIAKVPVGELIANAVTKSDKDSPATPILTQMGMVYGTPEYMAPEQALGQIVDARADLYALGIMAFEMLTGKRPFEQESKVALLGMHVTAPVPNMNERAPDAAIPPEVEAVVLKLLSKEASDRYADAKELTEAITVVLKSLAAQGRVDAHYGGVPASSVLSPALSPSPLTPMGEPSLLASGNAMTLLHTGDEPGLPAAKKPMNRRTTIGGAVIGALALGAIIYALAPRHPGPHTDPRTKPITTSSAMTSASSSATVAIPDPPAKPDEAQIKEAIALIEKGDFGTGVTQLTAIENDHMDRADLHRALENAYVATHQIKLAMIEAERWVKADPTASQDLKLKVDVRDAAIGKDAPDQAFAVLEQRMGSAGADVLYDIAYLASGAQYPAAAVRAKRSLGQRDVRSHASQALDVTLDLRDTAAPAHCAAKKLFERAAEVGDWRTALVLKSYVPTTGCGPMNKRDCFPCLHTDNTLQKTIAVIESRKTP